MTPEIIEHHFTYHAPNGKQQAFYKQLRDKGKELALLIHDVTPYTHEQTLAYDHLEQAIMCANAAIARYGEENA